MNINCCEVPNYCFELNVCQSWYKTFLFFLIFLFFCVSFRTILLYMWLSMFKKKFNKKSITEFKKQRLKLSKIYNLNRNLFLPLISINGRRISLLCDQFFFHLRKLKIQQKFVLLNHFKLVLNILLKRQIITISDLSWYSLIAI